jgi:hypothetical protein
MHIVRLCIVIVVLCENCLVGQTQAPSAVSVTSGGSAKLEPGQSFNFELQFKPAPEGYSGGTISYEFDNVAASERIVDGADSVTGIVALRDGQAIYPISLRITESMNKGKWQLVSVQMGKAVPKKVPITDNVSFEIPLPERILHVQAPEKITAGATFPIDVTLDEIPKVPPECTVILSFSIHPTVQAPVGAGNNVPVQSEQHSYRLTGKLDADVPSGIWKGLATLNVGASARAFEERLRCHFQLSPWLAKSEEFSLTVEPSPGLVTPTAVSATVNPPQIRLLLGEAEKLRAKAKHLEDQLALGNKTADQDLLRSSLREASEDLNKTEETFKRKGVEQSSMQAVNAFFDDIRFDYQDALGTLGSKVAGRGEKDGQLLMRVSAARAGAPPSGSGASLTVLKSIRHNANAYDIVANTKALTFTLEVYSEPDGATISYRRRGGEYHSVDHDTDWRIENLVRAVWQIRLQKPGFEDSEKDFDAIDSTGTSITIKLRRK